MFVYSKFQLQQTVFIFRKKSPKKEFLPVTNKKRTSPLNSSQSDQWKYQISALTKNFDFLEQICPKWYLRSQTKKNHYRILQIRNIFCTEFQVKLTFLNFWIKFAQKGYIQTKGDKMNTIIEFGLFEFVQIPNFSLNGQF